MTQVATPDSLLLDDDDDLLTDPPGVMGCRGHSRPNSPHTLHALLQFTKECRANPWLQIERHICRTRNGTA